MPPNKRLVAEEEGLLRTARVSLDKPQRRVVELAIREVCEHRRYVLHAVNVRTNHVHAVVVASSEPEAVMNCFKSYATRKLRQRDLLASNIKPWARHGSTRYLWTQDQLTEAIEYVMFGQGEEPLR